MLKFVWSTGVCVTALMLIMTGASDAEVTPGETITKDNLTQAEPLLTPSTRWMLEQGMRMHIIAPKKVNWPKAQREATQQYSGQVQLSLDGRTLRHYIAGYPFPTIDPNDPLAGAKVMWNFQFPPIDNFGAVSTTLLVDRNGAVEERIEGPMRWMKWVGRLYLEPKPQAPHNPPLHSSSLFGSVVLSLRYFSQDAPDETYVYDGRRPIRLPEADRSQTQGESDVDPDSFLGFSGKLSSWTFRLLEERDILAVVHSGKYGDPSQWCAPQDGSHGIVAALPCVSWEKRKVWVIEGLPAGSSSYSYSKRMLYIDQDFFGLVLTELYDQDEKLWKAYLPCLFYTTKPHTNYPSNPIAGAKYGYTEEWPFLPSTVMVDMQRMHATITESPSSAQSPSAWQNEVYFNEAVPDNVPAVYAPTSLRQ